ncbi:MAG: NADP-dependent isocitrate dehydrogenase [Gammaproteobacteria bacterium]
MKPTPITVAHGDGIGPEIMDATLRILTAAGAQLEIETIEIGEKVYKAGIKGGIRPEAWESLLRTQVFLKAPITTPQGGGFKSLNVTVRKAFGMYANVRPCVSYAPFVQTLHPSMDVVIVRENEEDLYAGIEYQQTPDMTQCLKLISVPGTEKIIRYAFEYAMNNNRKKVTCFSKDNIMKMTDGLFHKIFDTIAKEYPTIENEHWIVDIGAAKLADKPEQFDVIVMPNLYGDILSDVAAEIAGSVGLAGSANIGDSCSMFEAIHGSAPRRAGQDMANPSGLLQGAIMMLVHIGQADIATKVQNAWLSTLEEGIHTYDIHTEGKSRERVGTKAFADAVIARLGQTPKILKPAHYENHEVKKSRALTINPEVKLRELTGVDVFVYWKANDLQGLVKALQASETGILTLTSIGNRGSNVWPGGMSETFCTTHWRTRFESTSAIQNKDVVALMEKLVANHVDFIKTEQLYRFDGVNMFS